MGKIAVSVVDPDGDLFGVHGDLHPLPLAVGDHRECGVGRSNFAERVLVHVAAQHQIDTRTVEDRQELLRHIQIAVPCVLDLRGNMVEDDPSFGVLPLITLHHALEPFGLLVQIRLRAEPSLVLDVAVHLVLAAVQHQEQELAIFEGVVGAVLREVEIFRDPQRVPASELVVAAGHEERSLVGEQVAGRDRSVPDDLLAVGQVGGHVSVEQNEVELLVLLLVREQSAQ